MLFCRPDMIDFRSLSDLLSRVITLTPAEFEGVYQGLRSSFDRLSDSPFRDDFVRRPVALVSSTLVHSAALEHPGIDLPCWIEIAPSGHRIILLGQDPLRDDRYFSIEDKSTVVIGTPYSAHSASLRERGNSARYWKIMRHLLGAGYNLYLTDVSKFWARDHKVPPSAEQTYRMILQGELDLLAPSGSAAFVVAFGTRASAFLLGPAFPVTAKIAKAKIFTAGPVNVLPVLHPSPQNEGVLKGYLRANDVDPAQGVVGIAEVITRTIERFMHR